MARPDNVEKIALDRSAADFSAAGSITAAEADATAQTGAIDCLGVEFVDVTIDLSNLGSGPATKITVVGRASGMAAPDPAVGGNWTTINTEAVDTATGVATLVPYVAEKALAAAGRLVVTFPVRSRYFSALVWVDSASGTRGQVFTFRR